MRWWRWTLVVIYMKARARGIFLRGRTFILLLASDALFGLLRVSLFPALLNIVIELDEASPYTQPSPLQLREAGSPYFY